MMPPQGWMHPVLSVGVRCQIGKQRLTQRGGGDFVLLVTQQFDVLECNTTPILMTLRPEYVIQVV